MVTWRRSASVWSHKKIDYLGIKFSLLNREEVLKMIYEAVNTRRKLSVTFANPHSIYLATRRCNSLVDLLNSFDVLCADGNGIVWTSALVGGKLKERISATVVAPPLFDFAVAKGLGIYLLGSAPGVAEVVSRKLQKTKRGLRIVGTHHGYFDFSASKQVVDKINQNGADIVLVGMGTPLQEEWIVSNRSSIVAPALITCGGFMDQTTVRTSYYPIVIEQLNLNWLYRLYDEPGRLWKRYTIEILWLLWLILKYRLSSIFRENTKT